MQPLVQTFLRLVLSTGDRFRYRWNEQAVEGMLWQIFVNPDTMTHHGPSI